jgi:hypothetical protein
MQCNTTQCNAIQYNAMQCNTMQYNAIQCNTMQFNSNDTVSRFLHSKDKYMLISDYETLNKIEPNHPTSSMNNVD